MHRPPYEVLFLCTGNSARSILAERLLEHHSAGRFHGHSAGSFPRGSVHPLALALLTEAGLPTATLRSKPWDEFAAPGAPALDFVFTVCDQAAGEACPAWPGQPITAHWGLPDPGGRAGHRRAADARLPHGVPALERRIRLFTALPMEGLDRMALTRRVQEIGRVRPDAAEGIAS